MHKQSPDIRHKSPFFLLGLALGLLLGSLLGSLRKHPDIDELADYQQEAANAQRLANELRLEQALREKTENQ